MSWNKNSNYNNMHGATIKTIMECIILSLVIYLFITSGLLKVKAPTIIKSWAANVTKNYLEDCHSSI